MLIKSIRKQHDKNVMLFLLSTQTTPQHQYQVAILL